MVDALLLRPLPVREPSRLVDIDTSGADGDTYSTSSLPDILDYRDQTTVFDGIGAYSPMFAGVNRGGGARLVLGEVVTGNYFMTLGVTAVRGRTLLPADDDEGASRTIVLSNRYWQREFGGEEGAIGQSLRIRGQQFWSEITRRIEALPGVEGVALASRLPFSLNFNSTQIAVPGHEPAADTPGTSINSAIVSPGYFRTLGVNLLEGRAFAATDTPATRAVVIVTESFARRYWPGASAVGQIVFERMLSSGRSYEIVGVVSDHAQRQVGEPRPPTVFFASTQRPSGYNVVVARTAGDDRALVGRMRDALLALEPDPLLLESQTMRVQMQMMLFPVRAAAAFVTVFSGLGLLLAAVGLYGIIAFTVAQRTREIGIRIAIGATPGTVVGLVLRQGVSVVAAGAVAGALLAGLATRLVAGALYGVSVADPMAWSAAGLALAAAALAAHAVPAWRASRIDPAAALKIR